MTLVRVLVLSPMLVLTACSLSPSSEIAEERVFTGGTGGGSFDVTPTPTPPPAGPIPPTLSSRAIDELIASDFNSLPSEVKKTTKYVSIDHLLTDDLFLRLPDLYRFSINMALNSTSTANAIKNLVPLNPQRTVYRFNLNDYEYSQSDWELLKGEKDYSKHVRKSGETDLIEGDWLVYAVTRPQYYARLMPTPLDEVLDPRLRQRKNVIYAGVDKSPVALNPRFMDRFDISYPNGQKGYAWQTYDFALEKDAIAIQQKALPQYYNELPRIPLQGTETGGANMGFTAKEFIYTLPNGLQAYWLSGFGMQPRLDVPVFAAQDPRRSDTKYNSAMAGIVLVGESCFSCHGGVGINGFGELMRNKALANPRLSASELEVIKQSYPAQKEWDAQIEKDRQIYAEARARLGFPELSGRDPIIPMVELYQTRNGVNSLWVTPGALGYFLPLDSISQ